MVHSLQSHPEHLTVLSDECVNIFVETRPDTPGVQPGAYLNAECLHRVADCHGAADRSLVVRTFSAASEALANMGAMTLPLAAPRFGSKAALSATVQAVERPRC
jgi:hypothetical protein